LWSRQHIDHVQITVAETVGVEHRGRFYEKTGALRDMVPNHVFQLLAMTAMEPPISFDADAVRSKKAEVIQAIHPIDPAHAVTTAVRGQYDAGTVLGKQVRAFASDEFRNRFPWQLVSWYWGDERFVPHDHPESNYQMTREAMLAKAPVPPENIHPIPTDGAPEDAARRYERTLEEAYGATTFDPQRPLFDITLLGLGPDGHTPRCCRESRC